MARFEGYPLLPETAMEGFIFGAVTPIDEGRQTGAGFLQGPDGSRAGIQWELADSTFIMRIEGPDSEGWGVYRLGFVNRMSGVDDLVSNLRTLLPKLKILYERARGRVH